MSNVTAYGRLVRELREEAGVRMKDMADFLGVRPSYLSSLETGRQELTEKAVRNAIAYFDHLKVDSRKIRDAAAVSKSSVKLDLTEVDEDGRQLILSFARKLPNLAKEGRETIRKVVEDD